MNNDKLKFRAWCIKTINNQWDYACKKANQIINVDILKKQYDFNRVYDLNEKVRRRYEKIWLKNNSLDLKYTKAYEMIDVGVENGNAILPYGYEWIDVMQSIGLKDKNNKLIFWGDILKGRYGCYIYKELWNGHELSCFFQDLKFKPDFAFEGYKLGIANQLEIIGNIHQNPELIKESK